MAHEILAVKLYQLDDRLERLHGRIRMSETANHDRLQREITIVKQECAETEAIFRESLRRSKAPMAMMLSENCEQIEQVIRKTDGQLRSREEACPDAEAAVEDKILLAEYALDFAQQAADRALLTALEAIDAQLLWQQEEGRRV